MIVRTIFLPRSLIIRKCKISCIKSELNSLRKKFEDEYFENKRLINKLAKKLERLFSSLNTNSWKFDQEEGHIDPSRLANLVANSKNHQILKTKMKILKKYNSQFTIR